MSVLLGLLGAGLMLGFVAGHALRARLRRGRR